MVETVAWDIQAFLISNAAVFAYLEAAFEDGDPHLIAAALGDVAKARGMMKVADDAGLSCESLYKALSTNGNPRLETITKVMKALGLGIDVIVADDACRAMRPPNARRPRARKRNSAGATQFKRT